MRVLEIFSSVIRGGTEEVALVLAAAMSGRGWDVHVAFPFGHGNDSLRHDFGAVSRVHDLGIREPAAGVGWPVKVLLKALRTRNLLMRLKPDVAVVHLPWQDHGLAASLGCAFVNVPTIVVFHLAPAPLAMGGKRLRLYRWARSRRQKWIAVSDFARDQVAATFQLSASQVGRIYNGVDRQGLQIDKTAARQRIREELGLDLSARLVLSVSRLDRSKGFDDIIPTIPYVLRRFPDVRFLWAGDGPRGAGLSDRIRSYGLQDAVFMLGRRRDIPHLLAACNLFLFPSYGEGLSLALLEAASSGIPVIASDSTSNPEVIRDEHNGLLFRTGDSCSMFERLAFALDNQYRMKELAAQAVQDMAAFTLEEMVRQHLDVCELVAAAAPKISASGALSSGA